MDDRKKPRRAGSHWGDEKRAAWGRSKTEPGTAGVPVEVDPEVTPPPREPPTADQFDTLPPAAQLRALRGIVAEQSQAIERVWDARHVAERLSKVEQIVAQDTTQVTHLIAAVNHWGSMTKEAFDKSSAISNRQIALDTRLGVFFDEQFPAFVRSIDGFLGTLNSVSARVSDVEANIDDLAAAHARHTAELAGLAGRVEKIEDTAHDNQIAKTAVTNEVKRWLSWANTAKAVIAAAIAIAGYLVGSQL